ncbi:MAG: HNH endonuclease [Ruminococcus sp.]|nr:HNH endonuclease [Ruminococcus sp.]
MSEIKTTETAEVKSSQVEGFKDIKPESEGSPKDVKSFWDNLFDSFRQEKTEYYTSYEDRIAQTPREKSENGSWEGERGESKFIPEANTEDGKAACEKLKEFGIDGIEYKDGIPDFSPITEATEIIDMTEIRDDNFKQAYEKCADTWNSQAKDGRNDWTARQVKEYKTENNLTWHENSDMKTVQLVPSEVHKVCSHSGGVAECKARNEDIGGGFDE